MYKILFKIKIQNKNLPKLIFHQLGVVQES